MALSPHSLNCVLAICGPPNSGKTTFSERLSVPVLHTDHWAHGEWDDQPDRVMEHVSREGSKGLLYAVEGCTVIRLLRRGFSPKLVVYMVNPMSPLEGRQRSLAASVENDFHLWTWMQTEDRSKFVPCIQSYATSVIEDLKRHNFKYLKET